MLLLAQCLFSCSTDFLFSSVVSLLLSFHPFLLDYPQIDPRMFDPAHVFKSIDAPKKVTDVLHAKKNAKRNRSGYDDDVKQVVHKSV